MKPIRAFLLTIVLSTATITLLLLLQVARVHHATAAGDLPDVLPVQIRQTAAPNPAADGQLLTYTLSLTNGGTAAVTPLVMDHVPPQSTPVDVVAKMPGPIAPGEAWTGALAVTVTEGYTGTLVNRVEAHSQWAANRSTGTTCAEEDNVNVPLYAYDVTSYTVTATHPTYLAGVPFSPGECNADFSGCASSNSINMHENDPCLATTPVYDDGTDVIRVCDEPMWWRSSTMSVTVNGSLPVSGERIVWNKRIAGTSEYPQFFVLYEDGNLRLKPQPPAGRLDTCFGSSLIVGPAAGAPRPFVDLEEVAIDVAQMRVTLHYGDGGTATLHVGVDRQAATVVVQADYDTSRPFATLRSMYVSERVNDVAQVETAGATYPFLQGDDGRWQTVWDGLPGHDWYFSRPISSAHNISAPDIRVTTARRPFATSLSIICSNACEQFLPRIGE